MWVGSMAVTREFGGDSGVTAVASHSTEEQHYQYLAWPLGEVRKADITFGLCSRRLLSILRGMSGCLHSRYLVERRWVFDSVDQNAIHSWLNRDMQAT